MILWLVVEKGKGGHQPSAHCLRPCLDGPQSIAPYLAPLSLVLFATVPVDPFKEGIPCTWVLGHFGRSRTPVATLTEYLQSRERVSDV